jgi:hypothetical protein
MIELRNRQYMTVIDCLAGEDLVVGNVIQLQYFEATDRLPMRAMKATAAADILDVTGPLFAHWIIDRSTAVLFGGGEDGLSFPLAASTDADSTHYIPSGSRMVAVGGKGVAEIRFFPASLDSEFASTLPTVGDTLEFSNDESLLCSVGNAASETRVCGLVLENDGVSVAVLIG